MALSIGRALGRGVRRALNPTGIVLMILMVLYALVFVGAINAIVASLLPAAVQESAQLGLALPVSLGGAVGIAAIAMLAGTVIILATTRAFTRPPPERAALTTDLFARRIGRAVVSAIGANIIVTIAVLIGFVLLVVPGIFLTVSFTFVVFAIGVEDARAVAALRRSWDLARGDRWRLLALLVIVGVVTGTAGGLGSWLSLVDPVGGQVASLGLVGILSVLTYGVLADAFVQLRGEPGENRA